MPSKCVLVDCGSALTEGHPGAPWKAGFHGAPGTRWGDLRVSSAPGSAPRVAGLRPVRGSRGKAGCIRGRIAQGAASAHVLEHVLTDVDLRIDPTRPDQVQRRREEPLAEGWDACEAARHGPAASAGHDASHDQTASRVSAETREMAEPGPKSGKRGPRAAWVGEPGRVGGAVLGLSALSSGRPDG